MKEKNIVRKWLDDNLSKEEQKAFEQSDAYSSLQKIDETAQHFRAPQWDGDRNWKQIQSKITESKKSRTVPTRNVLTWKIAATLLILIGVGIGLYLIVPADSSQNVVVATQNNSETLTLPDTSEVILNTKSSLQYAPNWNTERKVILHGEAFFKVAKGNRFDVETNMGRITVLGTQFNVLQKEDALEVTCFEGSVRVVSAATSHILKPGDRITIDSQYAPVLSKIYETNPTWIANQSTFRSVPYQTVITAIEAVYDVDIQLNDIAPDTLFTGSFTHGNLDIALKSVTLPLELKYTIANNSIVIAK